VYPERGRDMVHFEKEIVVKIKDKKISGAVPEFDINDRIVPRQRDGKSFLSPKVAKILGSASSLGS
jgi:hypothetical protein